MKICLLNHLLGSANTNSFATKLGDETVAKQHIIIFRPWTATVCPVQLSECLHVCVAPSLPALHFFPSLRPPLMTTPTSDYMLVVFTPLCAC